MQVATVLVLLVTCELCLTIRVPTSWDESASVVKQEIKNDNDEQFSVESFKTQKLNDKPIPSEYFEYTAKKPQFAIDVAKFHGVQSPENHYTAYPIKPHNGKSRPELGKHRILDKGNKLHRPLQEYANINEDSENHAVPVSSNYDVFHPYEAETPALQEIYKDPILSKIRSDLENSKNRLQTYEKNAGDLDISKDEYLESPEKTDGKFIPHRNIPAPYEIYRTQKRPVYYRPVARLPHREHHLNQRLKHPWNPYSAKIRPVHYKPIKNQIHKLRQNHALKYDDERNEYPQVHILENYSDPKDGYDIYERGKEKFVQLRNNVDESINKAVNENRPTTYEKLELENHDSSVDDDDEEFVPIKNYAQVRKTETYKHLPRSAALADAETFDEIRNAPRLREAVKSTKAQTVYSEEGYEDAAYDHAGVKKHASENEGHGGFLKQYERSGGKYKTPSENAKYQDGGGSALRDYVLHAEKWQDDDKDNLEEDDQEDYSEDENEKSFESKKYQDSSREDPGPRNKRENDVKKSTLADSPTLYEINKSDVDSDNNKERPDIKIPEIDIDSTFLTEKEIIELAKIKIEDKKDNTKQKYPYYYDQIQGIGNNSPLRYAENLKFIPKKSLGGTEFYDSRSNFECLEVDDTPDPIPEKLKRDKRPDDDDEDEDGNPSNKGDENYDTVNKTPRLKGLGDKIDCFKAKYFGQDPLDSPFFKEEIIANPEPIIPPSKFGLHNFKNHFSKIPLSPQESQLVIEEKKDTVNNSDIFKLIEKLRNEKTNMSISNPDTEIILQKPNNKNTTGNSDETHLEEQSNVYNDILRNIENSSNNTPRDILNVSGTFTNSTLNPLSNITYISYHNKEDVTRTPPHLRRKRSTPFVYEPYKIIRDSQVQDSKKTTTTNNISPLIRKLQSSRIIDRVTTPNHEIDSSAKHHKRNVNTRMYQDIGRKERQRHGSKNDKEIVDPAFIDVSIDSRRGEPRYEIRRPRNHKPTYTPVDNKKSMSIKEYKSRTNTDSEKGETNSPRQSRQRASNTSSNSHPDIQNVAESSNTVRKTISTTTTPRSTTTQTKLQQQPDDDDYEEYDDDDDDDEEELETTTTTSTTVKPTFRRKIKRTEQVSDITETPKLTLVTRFRDYKPEKVTEIEQTTEKRIPRVNKQESRGESREETPKVAPKYREKKKKTTKSTLVTDTKTYGDEDDDMQKEEVDALIGVKQNMEDYMPIYEKEEENALKNKKYSKENTNVTDQESDEYERENVDDEDDGDNEDDEDDEDDDIDDDEEDSEEEEDDDNFEPKPIATTPEPTKRTLSMTTEAPVPTLATRDAKQDTKPIVTRKKIEIHKELPVNKSSPHITQYKQDIKEVEIIKDLPPPSKKKPQKNIEALELYRDDNLAKDINKLGGVEIFNENIDLKNGPKHGGNYRQIEEPKKSKPKVKNIKDDAVASQSEFTKNVELDDNITRNRMHGGNLKSLDDIENTRSKTRSEKFIEISDTPSTGMHGGNLKGRNNGRNRGRNQKLIELDDDEHEDDTSYNDSHESFSNSRNSRPMHGGNYRSAKIVAKINPDENEEVKSRERGARRNAAAILNSFVQAVPILTTTPAYILDPSKRMYYYVD